MEIRIAGIVKESVVDGPGIRYVVFTQGCPHHCPGCHNPQTHAFDGGELKQTEDLLEQLGKNPLVRGLTLSGGEPLAQTEAVLQLTKGAKAMQKDVILYTGYTWEQVLEKQKKEDALKELLDQLWLVIEGPFLEAQKNLALPFRGNTNQRVIDVAKSLASGQIMEYQFS